MHLTWQQSIGIEESHLIPFQDHVGNQTLVNIHAIEALSQLLEQAYKSNISISIISGFRSFEQQLKIWNNKWQGHQSVYSRHGRPLNILKMSAIEKYKAISLWSALPGLSRHHWGTDFDIFASQPINEGYQVQLIAEEFATNGPCNKLDFWLTNHLKDFGFFRPYRKFQQGISIEPWHISHIHLSKNIISHFDKKACRDYIEASEIKSADFIKEQFEHYYQQYFCNICSPELCGKSQ